MTVAFSGRFAALTGLRIVPVDRAAAVRDVVLAILGVTSFIAVLDGLLFRTQLNPDYVALFASPLWPQMLALSALAAVEEVKFRLLLMTVLAAFTVRLQGRLSLGAVVAIVIAAQFANVGALVLADPLYATLRYWLVGCVWGWLYWRHGWLAALAGHSLTHPVLDPVLYAILNHAP